MDLVAQVDEIYSVRGQRIVHIRLNRDQPDRAAILAALLGPSGNLRAPAVRHGRTLVVGFTPDLFARLLG
jgi:hypothetical protein